MSEREIQAIVDRETAPGIGTTRRPSFRSSIRTLWRKRSDGVLFHWKGRACKGYTKVGEQWRLIFHTGLLDYEGVAGELLNASGQFF